MKKIYQEAAKNTVTLFLFYFAFCTIISAILYPVLEYIFSLFSKSEFVFDFMSILLNSLRNGLIVAIVLTLSSGGNRRRK